LFEFISYKNNNRLVFTVLSIVAIFTLAGCDTAAGRDTGTGDKDGTSVYQRGTNTPLTNKE
jgi:hypothetical protein